MFTKVLNAVSAILLVLELLGVINIGIWVALTPMIIAFIINMIIIVISIGIVKYLDK